VGALVLGRVIKPNESSPASLLTLILPNSQGFSPEHHTSRFKDEEYIIQEPGFSQKPDLLLKSRKVASTRLIMSLSFHV
jgi:hypothetical protein